jgi:type I restriction enzyme M protein
VDRFFAAERDALAAVDQRIAEAEANVTEAVEAAQALLEYEPDEDETVSAATLRPLLRDACGDTETDENRPFREAAEALRAAESALREQRAERDRLGEELKLKIELKLFGADDRVQETQALLNQAQTELAAVGGPLPAAPPIADGPSRSGAPNRTPVAGLARDRQSPSVGSQAERATALPARRGKDEPRPTAAEKAQLKRRQALAADVATLESRLAAVYRTLDQIGGQIASPEARELVLRKHHDLVAGHLQRYVQAEERALFAVFDNLFAKYATSAEALETQLQATLDELQGFLGRLGYG